jgi:hypothetical protein
MSDEHVQPDPDPRRDDSFEEDRPHRRSRDDDDRPRRRRRDDDDDDLSRRIRDEGDATGGLIPYKNPKALISYYCGVFSLIPCLGLILGPIALVLGLLGLSYKKQHPTAGGTAHAVVGIVLGSLVLLGHLGVIVAIFAGAALK